MHAIFSRRESSGGRCRCRRDETGVSLRKSTGSLELGGCGTDRMPRSLWLMPGRTLITVFVGTVCGGLRWSFRLLSWLCNAACRHQTPPVDSIIIAPSVRAYTGHDSALHLHLHLHSHSLLLRANPPCSLVWSRQRPPTSICALNLATCRIASTIAHQLQRRRPRVVRLFQRAGRLCPMNSASICSGISTSTISSPRPE